MTTTATATVDVDSKFEQRIRSALETARAWDADPALLLECRGTIPFDRLRDHNDPLWKDSNKKGYSAVGNLMFLHRLSIYFKDMMTWVNNPQCVNCGDKNTSFKDTRKPETDEEKEGKASRVELYHCPTCNDVTTNFPRYNSVRKLLQTKKGRCGEYANLFGLFCRSVGFETRYIHDVTDHVWVEIYCPELESWVMADGCEGVIYEPSMYEHGWGKQLSCMIGVATDHTVEVTPRYTRQWNNNIEFHNRRREVVSSDAAAQQIITKINNELKAKLNKNRIQQLDQRLKQETEYFTKCRQALHWEKDEQYGLGRISGSLAWKVSRQEAGRSNNNDKNTEGEDGDVKEGRNSDDPKKVLSGFLVESFYCPSSVSSTVKNSVCIKVQPNPMERHDAITVSGCSCAVQQQGTISVVVVDEKYLGCILQSRCFQSIEELADFIHRLPEHRIIAIHGHLPLHDEGKEQLKETEQIKLSRLGGFDPSLVSSGKGVLYVGQIDAQPDWMRCSSFEDSENGIQITIEKNDNTAAFGDLKLRTERNTRPHRVVGRLPESVMPLQTQLMASEEQKRIAFLNLVRQREDGKESNVKRYSGYCTKPHAPVYLLDAYSYPFKQSEATESSSPCWNTFHLLPPPLVPEDDRGIADVASNADENASIPIPKFDIPLDAKSFVMLLGDRLLSKNGIGSPSSSVDTTVALHNSRLVCLYFSAHWCGPCRMFTPMLIEMYEHLKDEVPSHGMEIVFVSSDRDQRSFDQYYNTMPWLAVPFDSLQFLKNQISMSYGIRGIPSLVVLDSMSGEIVVSTDQSRGEIQRACQGGEDQIVEMLKSWLDRIPMESKDIMNMLEISCNMDNASTDDANAEHSSELQNKYFFRSGENTSVDPALLDTKTRFTQIWTKLVERGMDRNDAAAKAIEIVANPHKMILDPGPLNGFGRVLSTEQNEENSTDQLVANISAWNNDNSTNEKLTTLLNTTSKYLDNVKKEPYNPKFRNFKLSNKIADRITQNEGGIQLLVQRLGFDVYGTQQECFGCVPLGADLEAMQNKILKLLSGLSSTSS